MKLRRQSLLFILLVVGALLMLLPTAAQSPTPAYEVVLAAGEVGDNVADPYVHLYVLSSDGEVQRYELPPDLIQDSQDTPVVRVTPDRRYALVSTFQYDPYVALPLAIYDLQTGSCCIEIAPPAEEISAYQFSGFDPTGTQIAVSWVSFGSGANPMMMGGLFVVDVATGQKRYDVPTQTLLDGLNAQDRFAPWMLLGDWDARGIRMHPTCYACEGVIQGEWSLWNPADNTFTAHSGEWFSFFADHLEATGEALAVSQNTRFPHNPTPGMFGVPNVVNYYADGRVPGFDQPNPEPVIFYDPRLYELNNGAHWVNDGREALITGDSGVWITLNRAGERTAEMTVSQGSRFLTGTPDGYWYLLNEGDHQRLMVSSASGLSFDLTFDVDARVQVIDQPALGGSLTLPPQPFPAITPPAPEVYATLQAQTGFACDGFLPSRLFPGGTGRVTLGTPNRLRQYPGIDAPIIGEIPGGAQFTVIGGLVCDVLEGIAWWEVEYNGQRGWTAEGQGSEYFVEPVLP